MNRTLHITSVIFFLPSLLLAQTVLYNGGTSIYADAGSVIYVNGEVVNDVNGSIHNKGDIYLTHDWTNKDAAGCLDPTTGTVWLYGNAQIIKGTQPTKFNNLNCENGGTKTLNINTYVGGTSGVLKLKTSPFILSSKTLFMTNPSNGGITRTTGYIVSETTPVAGYGIVQWDLGNSTGNYIYPFGTAGGSYIPFNCNITAAGVQSTAGNMAVSTYPTSVITSPNNLPLPTGVTNLNDASSNNASLVCLDRFWVTQPNNYTTAPTASVSFTYQDAEWNTTGGSTNTIVEDSLKAWRWNTTSSQWINPSTGTDNTSLNTVAVPSVNAFSIWTLKGKAPCSVSASLTASLTTVTLGGSVSLTAGGGGTYLWNTGATTSSINVVPSASTLYCVTVTNPNGGCTDSACVDVKVELPCGEFWLPNAFSPNSDNKNEYFKPRSICIKTIDFRIYNRWGNLVYASLSPTDIGWDGSVPGKGKDGNEGVYAYEIKATLNDGTLIDQKGTVTLLK